MDIDFKMGFAKLGMDLSAIRRAFSSLKNSGKLIRRNLTKGTHIGNKRLGMPSALDPKVLSDKGRHVVEKAYGKKPHIFMRGNTIKGLRESMSTPSMGLYKVLNPKKLDGKNKEMFSRILGMHEAHELRATKEIVSGKYRKSSLGSSHISPSVMLREHNMTKTLPSDFVETKKMLQGLRADDGSVNAIKEKVLKKFKYGESPRLSRHAIKNISKTLGESY